MHILTINLEAHYQHALTTSLDALLCHTHSFEAACRLIDSHDHALIIKACTSKPEEHEQVTQLLALTPLSTQIMLIGNDVPNLQAWQEMGIRALPNPSPDQLIEEIKTNIDKFTA